MRMLGYVRSALRLAGVCLLLVGVRLFLTAPRDADRLREKAEGARAMGEDRPPISESREQNPIAARIHDGSNTALDSITTDADRLVLGYAALPTALGTTLLLVSLALRRRRTPSEARAR